MRKWLLLPTLLLLTCGELRQDELLCEEATARLTDCCNDFATREMRCVFDEGCNAEVDGPARVTDLSVEESTCVLDLSCAEVRGAGLCGYPEAGASARLSIIREACPGADPGPEEGE